MYIMCFRIQLKWLYKEPHRYVESVSGYRHSEFYHYNSSLFEKIILLFVYVYHNIGWEEWVVVNIMIILNIYENY